MFGGCYISFLWNHPYHIRRCQALYVICCLFIGKGNTGNVHFELDKCSYLQIKSNTLYSYLERDKIVFYHQCVCLPLLLSPTCSSSIRYDALALARNNASTNQFMASSQPRRRLNNIGADMFLMSTSWNADCAGLSSRSACSHRLEFRHCSKHPVIKY